MSDSRLEKFIYAICSMDVSDLPVPLSRIEKLWNCLITGETPDFEPLSRNEKYLMAMLDRYDISNLPAPMSRGEKLLYKIAVGETDLSDVPGYLSRYEELLKYLIENGGISGGDFEYVLYTINQSMYTLYTTAEKPVKSAILMGQTLVNLVPNKGENTIVGTGYRLIKYELPYVLSKNKKYLLCCNIKTFTTPSGTGQLVFSLYSDNGDIYQIITNSTSAGYFKTIITTSDQDYSTQELWVYVRISETTSATFDNVMLLEYQDGMENWDIPYFEGMQSVKMPVLTTTGKNLFDVNGNKELSCFYSATNNGKLTPHTDVDTYTIKIKPNTTYTLSCIGKTMSHITYWDDSLSYVSSEANHSDANLRHITTPSKANYVKFPIHKQGISEIQIEEGTQATSYEPYKSNILTVNEDVTLRGVGDVQDTLDCLTRELTERIGEIIFNGGDEYTWTVHSISENTIRFQCSNVPIPTQPNASIIPNILCDKLKVVPNNDWRIDEEQLEVGIGAIKKHELNIRILKTKLIDTTPNSLNKYLQTNPITIQYELATESIKTVDLTVVDQDNQPTQLGTFENVTHVSLESAGLIPEVEMEVATRISKELASASPLMDDISTNQQQLEITVDEQSNNVDATMIATTEIYEGTL